MYILNIHINVQEQRDYQFERYQGEMRVARGRKKRGKVIK